MATLTTTALAHEYQKYFTKQLLEHAVQLTVLDQFALKQPLPKNKGAKTISFFRRSRSAVATSGAGAGRVANVQTLTEGTAISTFANHTLDRVDVALTQYGEASKVTDVLCMTELFDALKQNIALMSEDCALNADSITRDALVDAAVNGITLVQASGSTTEHVPSMYAQGQANFAALAAATPSAAKATATDFLRAATQLKINRAPAFGGYYVAVVPPQVSHDLQNDPDWIDSANAGEPDRRFRGELRTYAGVRFVEHTNPYLEDGTGDEGTYAVATAASDRIYRTFVLGQGAYGVPSIEGESPYNPQIMIVDRADKTDPLNQYMTAGWKAFWAASALNCPFAISLSSKTEFA